MGDAGSLGNEYEWINLADIEAAKAAGSEVGMDISDPPEDGVWELSPYWSESSWLRITQTDQEAKNP